MRPRRQRSNHGTNERNNWFSMTPPLFSLNFRVDERLLSLWANDRGFAPRNGGQLPGRLYHHALIELLGDRTPEAFSIIRHHSFGISIAFYSPFDLDALRRPSRGRGVAAVENTIKFKRAYCAPAPKFKPGELVAFLVRICPDAELKADRSMPAGAIKQSEYSYLQRCVKFLANEFNDCGEEITIELVEMRYDPINISENIHETFNEWTPSLLLRCEMNISNICKLNDLMLSGVGNWRHHGYGMLRISTDWRSPIITV